MTKRIAIVVGLGLLLGAVLFTAWPTSAQDSKCGHWFNPEWDRERSQNLAQEFFDLAEEAEASGDDEIRAESESRAYSIASSYRRCDDALATRRNLSIGLLIAAGVIPAAILYVGRRDDQDHQTATL